MTAEQIPKIAEGTEASLEEADHHLLETEQPEVDNPESIAAAEPPQSESINSIDPTEEADWGKTETVEGEAEMSAEPAAAPTAAATIAASSSDPLPVAVGEEDSVPPPTSPFLAAHKGW